MRINKTGGKLEDFDEPELNRKELLNKAQKEVKTKEEEPDTTKEVADWETNGGYVPPSKD